MLRQCRLHYRDWIARSPLSTTSLKLCSIQSTKSIHARVHSNNYYYRVMSSIASSNSQIIRDISESPPLIKVSCYAKGSLVIVPNLSPDVLQSSLRYIFMKYGVIKDIKPIYDSVDLYDTGYWTASLRFMKESDAKNAVMALENSTFAAPKKISIPSEKAIHKIERGSMEQQKRVMFHRLSKLRYKREMDLGIIRETIETLLYPRFFVSLDSNELTKILTISSSAGLPDMAFILLFTAQLPPPKLRHGTDNTSHTGFMKSGEKPTIIHYNTVLRACTCTKLNFFQKPFFHTKFRT